ncbi:hypothetical protein KSF_098940 [Reticulibacter mediterranei]|uniref:Uncharacterized protein n=1 Tax=Reticulibacter mediterranei TaxID=2778369 RepID=A0A8J3J315_9CHLR|nr:hypothetical protein KSF_098940 [Reticulibacter mediterranei]
MKLSPEELKQAMKWSDAAGDAAKGAFIRCRLSQQQSQES